MNKTRIIVMICLLTLSLLWISGCKKTDVTYPALTLTNGQSYDFTTGVTGMHTGGDFYYFSTGPAFFANNLNQRGTLDLGDLDDTDLADVTIPEAGYSRQSTACVNGHTYVSLAHIGEEGHFIVFRVTSLVANTSVTIEWLYK